MRRVLVSGFLFVALLGGMSATAFACPMCSAANEAQQSEEENLRPRAYMYSILFMLAMPATVLAGFGIGFYRLSRQNGAPVDSHDGSPPTDQPGE